MAAYFISYNRQSEAVVKTLAADIEALGHDAWLDRELSGGQAWWGQILEQIRTCEVFVFALAPEALNSTACSREHQYAADLGKPILPVLVAEGVSTNLLPPALSAVQFVDYRQRDPDAAFRLARAINHLPSPEPLPDPLPEPPELPISYLGRLQEQVATPATLTFEQQSALLIDLKRSLRDPETRDDASTLIERLKKRRDLLASISKEIDDILPSTTNTSSVPTTFVPNKAEEEKSRRGQASAKSLAPERRATGGTQEKDESRERDEGKPDWKTKKRLIPAGLIGLSVVLLAVFYFWPPPSPAPPEPESVAESASPVEIERSPPPNGAETSINGPKGGLEYVKIPDGEFQMGCVAGDDDCGPDEQPPPHKTKITKSFWLSRTEVTVEAYRRFVDDQNLTMPSPPGFNPEWGHPDHPIVRVSWDDAQQYCDWAGGRLPTEAEWEYAARGGKQGKKYPWGDEISKEHANYGSKGTTPVAQYAQNDWGLYDVSGNGWEWTKDWYDKDYYKTSPEADPPGPTQQTSSRVVRGGSWINGDPRYLHCSGRLRYGPVGRDYGVGFRCVREVSP